MYLEGIGKNCHGPVWSKSKNRPRNRFVLWAFWSNFAPEIKQLPTSCPAPSLQPCSVPIVSPASPPVRKGRVNIPDELPFQFILNRGWDVYSSALSQLAARKMYAMLFKTYGQP
jgi:hypothetical protein